MFKNILIEDECLCCSATSRSGLVVDSLRFFIIARYLVFD